MSDSTIVHLLRHGEVENPAGIIYGRLPGYHLSANGRAMARAAADFFAERPVVALFCSPLERAQETARPVAERLGRYTKWHFGMLRGSSALLLCRDDGLNWAAVFNSDANRAGKEYADEIDGLLHQTANQIKDWPAGDLYKNYAI